MLVPQLFDSSRGFSDVTSLCSDDAELILAGTKSKPVSNPTKVMWRLALIATFIRTLRVVRND